MLLIPISEAYAEVLVCLATCVATPYLWLHLTENKLVIKESKADKKSMNLWQLIHSQLTLRSSVKANFYICFSEQGVNIVSHMEDIISYSILEPKPLLNMFSDKDFFFLILAT